MHLRTIKVKKVATFRDGGTIHYEDREGNQYFVDNRLGTKTPGKIYDRYPSEEGARGIHVKLQEVDDWYGKATTA